MKKALLIIMALLGLAAIYTIFNLNHILFRETYKDVKVIDAFTKKGGEKDIFMVFVEMPNGETKEFKNIDTKFSIDFKWNSGKLQSKAAKAEKHSIPCDITVYGRRRTFFSRYPNIVKVDLKE